MHTKKYFAAAFLIGLTTLTLTLTSCTKEQTQNTIETLALPTVLENKSVEFYLLIGGKKLLKMNLQSLDAPGNAVELDGMESGEIISGIDFRLATGQLYGIGSTSRLYLINPETGKMRAIGTAPFTPAAYQQVRKLKVLISAPQMGSCMDLVLLEKYTRSTLRTVRL